MTTPRQKLQTLLFELFQFDSADLNFGIYAVMNRKRTEIEQFIRRQLLDEVERGLLQVATQSHSEAKVNFTVARNELIATLGESALVGNELAPAFENLRSIPVVQSYLKAKAEQESTVVSHELEMDIYNALYEFFSRYYKEGDFMPERRYGSRDSYAIPYNGDEVYLHWANRDQYYVKTSEYFTNYRFTIKGGLGTAREIIVAFALTQAETARDNNKAPNRYFIQPTAAPPTWDKTQNLLRIPFQYRPLTDDEKGTLGTRGNHIQPRLNEQSHAQISAALIAEQTIAGMDAHTRSLVLERLHEPHRKRGPAESESSNSSNRDQDELGYQLHRYTATNSRDFFVHKDLAGFLTREFDYYLKAEVADLDNLQSLDPVRLQREGAKVATTRAIGKRIIAFLDQIESFQKLLFLKPKFVLQSDYCLTLDKIPAAERARLYPTIAANDRQRAEWATLYGITLTADTDLDAHPHLMVDTAFFDEEFKLTLLACFEDIDEACDGLLIHGENFQALGLIGNRYERAIKCIYIDPPYNTQEVDFPYIDGYKISTWMTNIENRAIVAQRLQALDGLFFFQIGDDESSRSKSLLETIFVSSQ